jgi:hypothetical protein
MERTSGGSVIVAARTTRACASSYRIWRDISASA